MTLPVSDLQVVLGKFVAAVVLLAVVIGSTLPYAVSLARSHPPQLTSYAVLPNGPELISAMIKGSTKTLRGWFFCLAFVSIGLATNVRVLMPYFRGGKPLVLWLWAKR